MRFETSDMNADIAESDIADSSPALSSSCMCDRISDLAAAMGKEFEEPSTVALKVDNIAK